MLFFPGFCRVYFLFGILWGFLRAVCATRSTPHGLNCSCLDATRTPALLSCSDSRLFEGALSCPPCVAPSLQNTNKNKSVSHLPSGAILRQNPIELSGCQARRGVGLAPSAHFRGWLIQAGLLGPPIHGHVFSASVYRTGPGVWW